MFNVLHDDDIPASAGVSIEYNIPLTQYVSKNAAPREVFKKMLTGSTQKNIRKDDFFDFKISIPDQKNQNKYQLMVEKIRFSLSNSLDAFGQVNIFSSLSQKAFKGAL
jgi:hypothetical protein